MKYDFKTIEEKWQKFWQEQEIYKTNDDLKKEKYYVLDMFPYPSGEGLHVGHPKGYIATDILARQKMMEGRSVLHPMGWDAFGLPAENYAIKNKVHPAIAVKKNILRFKEQLAKLGFTYDWDRELNTTDPKYYKWTQWAFLKMFEKGLAYESFEPINWCPSCKTGLANEDLEDGKCERCGSIVEKKPMRQWVLRITDYADRLLEGLKDLNWPESIKESQRNWIGRSEGAEIDFQIEGLEEKITVFTTRIDTLFGASYVVLAPEHPLIKKLEDKISNLKELNKYIEGVLKKTEIDRTAEDREKTGVEIKGLKAINPANNEVLPIWVADYVLGDYGTGAVMAVPMHDTRDFQFATKYNLAIKQVIAPETGVTRENETFVTGVCAIIYNPKNKKFAVAEWAEGWGQGLYGLFGGNKEANESSEEAIKREVLEESGLTDFSSLEYLYSTVSHYYNYSKKSARRATVDCFLIILNSDKQVETKREEHETFSLGWREAQEILNNWQARDQELGQESNYDHWIEFLQRALERLHDKKIISLDSKFRFDAFVNDGYLCNSGEYNGLSSAEAREKITKGVNARKKIRYRLRDWVFSRQRYWGEPIPIVHCEKCGVVGVSEKDLPVTLPDVESYEPSGTGESPLANITEWVNTKCPKCKGDAKRETNTMPQWAGSSWYYLRYIDPKNDKALVDKLKEAHWSPVDMYVGGAEHATRHLIYARFWHKFLFDIGVVSYSEPFSRYTNLGLIMGADGRKMSKRYGNVINPDDMVEKYGADAFRIYEMFLSPFTQSASFLEAGVAGAKSFLNRVALLSERVEKVEIDEKIKVILNQTIKKIGDDINNFKFNTAVSSLMILTNALIDSPKVSSKSFSILVQLLAPFAPHIAEELWSNLGNKDSIFKSNWPSYDKKYLVDEVSTIVVQVNARVRDTFEIAHDSSEEKIRQEALARPAVQRWLEGKEIKKIIVVKGKVVNIVV